MTCKSSKPLLFALYAVLALTSVGNANAGMLLSGDSENDGWSFVGNSRDATDVIYARGGSTNFDSYFTDFTLSASDEFNSTNTVQGSPVGLLLSGTWQAGDRIIGLGISVVDGSNDMLNSAFFKLDFGGTGAWTAASSLDGADGNGSFSNGGQGSIIAQSIQSGNTFAPAGNAVRENGANVSTEFASALRSFAVITGDFFYSDMQFLINYNELLRLGIPAASFGEQSKFVINASGLINGDNTTPTGADIAFSRSLQATEVSSPGILSLFLLAMICVVLRRKA